MIKSGGEWISSVDLENALMAHPAVAEAAVIAIPDEKWQERPLAAVVLKPGASATAEELREFLRPQFAKWWLPDRIELVRGDPEDGRREVHEARAPRAVRAAAGVGVAVSADRRPRLGRRAAGRASRLGDARLSRSSSRATAGS